MAGSSDAYHKPPRITNRRGPGPSGRGRLGEHRPGLEDVLAAVNALDARNFRGPYALALAPVLYNGLFRRYAGTDMLQLEHLRRLCQRGVYKAAIEGGVLVDPRVGKLIIGQDLMAGYIG